LNNCLLELAVWPAAAREKLALALREIGKLERTLFLPGYIQNIELRKRIHAGLNKGEARATPNGFWSLFDATVDTSRKPAALIFRGFASRRPTSPVL
jgi:hypothetical protein